jgi:hypothetical protein
LSGIVQSNFRLARHPDVGIVVDDLGGTISFASSASRSKSGPLSEEVEIIPLDEELARSCGELCGASNSPDVIDASVVIIARERRDPIVTFPLTIPKAVSARKTNGYRLGGWKEGGV